MYTAEHCIVGPGGPSTLKCCNFFRFGSWKEIFGHRFVAMILHKRAKRRPLALLSRGAVYIADPTVNQSKCRIAVHAPLKLIIWITRGGFLISGDLQQRSKEV